MDSDIRSPIKCRKPKSFKFLHKKEKEEKDREEKEERRREKEGRKREKEREREREKEEKLRAKEAKKRVKKDKKKLIDPYSEDSSCVIFGIPLCIAVDRNPSHDGVKLPAIVRQCIDYIEDNGILCEGIYRLSGVKSKVQQLRRAYNSAVPVSLVGQDPHVVASLLKQFLRELPEPVLTADMTTHFEDASQIPGWRDRAEAIWQLLHRLPTPNSTLVQYILTHMGHIIDREAESKMNYQNVCIVLSPIMRISHRVLNVFFQNHHYLFGGVHIRRYIAPLQSCSEVERVQGLVELQQEVQRQESVLSHLHRLLASSPHNTIVQERLWESQRILTLLKRKLKLCQVTENELRETGEEGSSEESQRESVSEATNNSVSIITTASESNVAVVSVLPVEYQERSANSVYNTGSNNTYVVSKVGASADEEQTVRASDPGTSENMQGSTNDNSALARMSDKPPSTITRVPVTVVQEIPKLPKPVSGRHERSKLAHTTPATESAVDVAFTASTAKTNTFMVSDTLTEADNSFSKTLSEGRRSSGHVTVINISREPPDGAACSSVSVTTSSMSTLSVAATQTGVDEELVRLVREEAQQLAYHAELLAMNHDLSRKLQAEHAEICRLKDEIQELQTLYGYRTYSYDSSESGGESEGGVQAGDSDTEEELQQQLLVLQQENMQLQLNNQELVQRIQAERDAVVLLRARLRQTQTSCLPSFTSSNLITGTV